MENENEELLPGWSDFCCICAKRKVSYHNPEPLRDGEKNCCSDCNRLVIRARERIFRMSKNERQAYTSMLRDLPYGCLKEVLLSS